MLGSPKEERRRPKGVKNDQLIVTPASRRTETPMASVGQSGGSSILMPLVRVSQSNQWDQVQVGPCAGGHWKLGEVVYWKPKAVNHETYNENNRTISAEARAPSRA